MKAALKGGDAKGGLKKVENALQIMNFVLKLMNLALKLMWFETG